MPEERVWGTVVRKAIDEAKSSTPFGQRISHGVAYQLPLHTPDAQFLAINHLLKVVASLESLVQLLADELDRRDVASTR